MVVNFKDTVKLPVIMAPMFLVSSPKMVIEGCKAGVIGSFPLLNARTGADLEQWFEQITTELAEFNAQNPSNQAAPWAVNFMSHPSNHRFEEDLQLIKKYQPPIVISSLGDPSPVVSAVHSYGGLVFADVINLFFAQKAADKGVDGLILVCNGAGGHAGTLNPMAFIGAVKEFWNGYTILSGCISNGKDILAAEVLGADFAFIGTRFIPAHESLASEGYDQMLIESSMDDLIYTDVFSGVKANYLKPSIVKAGLDPNNLGEKGDLSYSRENRTVKAWKDIWSAGQGVHSIKKTQSTVEIITEMKEGYSEARNKLFVAQT
ncbi:NAD(P)H-dependent flavin oxidoreductase [Bacillus massiliigorillae]|uniref:NAD(P)H-dependent flavin oxidoreductase n=1 Tax=Bacillus massiliigorillae TaxID=1243664 RepID=UPI0003AB2D7B|nr:nitronate monooxygenase [Bacillus massiliigorillae]